MGGENKDSREENRQDPPPEETQNKETNPPEPAESAEAAGGDDSSASGENSELLNQDPSAGETPPAVGETVGADKDKQGPSEEETQEKKRQDAATTRGNNSGAISAAVFWAVVLGIVGYNYYYVEAAEVLLNVSPGESPAISGTVLYAGKPSTSGVVQLRVEHPQNERYLGSTVLSLDKMGQFTTGKQPPFWDTSSGSELHVQATYVGHYQELDDKGQPSGDPEKVSGSATAYVNSIPPLGDSAWWIAGVVAVPVLVLVLLFTGPITPGKSRWMFFVTYLATFFACVIPIAATLAVAHDPYVTKLMEEAPIGIVEGTSAVLDTPQWLLNIGGSVTRQAAADAGAEAQPTSTTEPSLSEGEAVLPASGDQPPSPTPIPDSSPARDADERPAGLVTVEGGLVIPLYMIVLAMVGAGINMTRKVPEIQKDYDAVHWTLTGLVKAPVEMFGGSDEQQIGRVSDVQRIGRARIRQELIQLYMYFISAPFLAIAAYYLVQVVANSVTTPALVVTAFATGLTSNAVVSAIIKSAEGLWPNNGQSSKNLKSAPPASKPASPGSP